MTTKNAIAKTLNIDGLAVALVRSKRRTLGLEISPHGVKARAPVRMSERDIVEFIQHKRAWIDKHQANMPLATEKTTLELKNGATIKLRGADFTLNVISGSRQPVSIQTNQITVPVIDSNTPLETRVKNKLIKWYKHVAQNELQTRARYYAELMNVPPRRTDQIYVRDYKRRWGSCDSKGKLSFNWRILQAPTAVSDYVVIHELAHCHEFNHSKRFWSIVAKQMPDYKEHDAWLSQHGHSLYKF